MKYACCPALVFAQTLNTYSPQGRGRMVHRLWITPVPKFAQRPSAKDQSDACSSLLMSRRFVLVVVLVLVIDWVVCFRGRGRARGRIVSWSQCIWKNERRLSMNRKVGQASRLTADLPSRSRACARRAGETPALRWAHPASSGASRRRLLRNSPVRVHSRNWRTIKS